MRFINRTWQYGNQVSHEDLPLWGGGHYTVTGGPSNRPTASRPLYCATFLGTFADLAALAASIATTLDATSPATTAETSAGTAAGEQSVTADGIQPVAAMAHLGLKMKGGQPIHRQHKSSPDLPRSVLGVLGNGSRDGGSGHLEQLSYTCLICMHSTKQKPGPSWVKWAIRKERSDAAARQNETQRQFDYVASAPAHEQLLTSKRAALQAAMQEQLD
ncbi:hypothetical protein V8C86DRAFT_2995150 [Haematococcus lacustris]